MNIYVNDPGPIEPVERIVSDHQDREAAWSAAAGESARLDTFARMLRAERRRRTRRSLLSAVGILMSAQSSPRPRSAAVPAVPVSREPADHPRRLRTRARFVRRSVLLGLVIVVAHTAIPESTERLLAPVFANLPVQNARLQALERNIDCSRAQAVTDREGRFVGARLLAGRDCGKVDPQVMATPVGDAQIAPIAAAIEAIEGRSRGWRSLFGVVELATFLRLAEWALGDRIKPTGTPPLQSALELAANKPHAMSLGDKLAWLTVTARYVARHLAEFDARARFLADRTRCLVARPGGGWVSYAGGACVLLLTGRDGSADLSLGESCIVAASFGQQIWIAPEDAPAGARTTMKSTVNLARRRAQLCVARLARDAHEAASARAWLEIYAPVPPPTAPILAAMTSVPLAAGLLDALSTARTARTPVVLALSAAELRTVAERVAALFPSVDHRLAQGLCLRPDCPDRKPDFALVVAELIGDRLLTRVALSNRHGMTSEHGRRFGSLAKVPVILDLGRTNESHLCDRGLGGLRNPGGDTGAVDCSAGQGLVPVRDAVARSLNLPFIDHVRRHADRFRWLLPRLGLRITVDAASDGEFAAGAVLGFGATMSMESHIRLLATIRGAAEGSRLRAAGPVALESGADAASLDLAELGYTRAEVARAAILLRAPLAPGGTLAALRPLLELRGCDVKDAIGKTGTTETASDRAGVAGKTILAAFQCGARTFVGMVSLAAPASADVSIGGVTAADLARLLDAAIGGLLAREVRT